MKKQNKHSDLPRYRAIRYHPLSGTQKYGFILHEGDVLEANDVHADLDGTWAKCPFALVGKPLTGNWAENDWIRPCPLPPGE